MAEAGALSGRRGSLMPLRTASAPPSTRGTQLLMHIAGTRGSPTRTAPAHRVLVLLPAATHTVLAARPLVAAHPRAGALHHAVASRLQTHTPLAPGRPVRAAGRQLSDAGRVARAAAMTTGVPDPGRRREGTCRPDETTCTEVTGRARLDATRMTRTHARLGRVRGHRRPESAWRLQRGAAECGRLYVWLDTRSRARGSAVPLATLVTIVAAHPRRAAIGSSSLRRPGSAAPRRQQSPAILPTRPSTESPRQLHADLHPLLYIPAEQVLSMTDLPWGLCWRRGRLLASESDRRRAAERLRRLDRAATASSLPQLDLRRRTEPWIATSPGRHRQAPRAAATLPRQYPHQLARMVLLSRQLIPGAITLFLPPHPGQEGEEEVAAVFHMTHRLAVAPGVEHLEVASMAAVLHLDPVVRATQHLLRLPSAAQATPAQRHTRVLSASTILPTCRKKCLAARSYPKCLTRVNF
jgi:hypothetical protein